MQAPQSFKTSGTTHPVTSHTQSPEFSATLLFSQWCRWRSKLSGVCHYVDLCIVSDIKEELVASFFGAVQTLGLARGCRQPARLQVNKHRLIHK